jgi:rhodanese-related sulfurtransferase
MPIASRMIYWDFKGVVCSQEKAMKSAVTEIAAAPSHIAMEHFAAEFTFEADCWDVHEAMSQEPDFVLLDVRSPAMFAQGHVPGAVNLPHGKIIRSKMAQWPEDTVFVTYCAGPHCNGAARGALRLAGLGRPVKIMAGGMTGWIDEGFDLAVGA